MFLHKVKKINDDLAVNVLLVDVSMAAFPFFETSSCLLEFGRNDHRGFTVHHPITPGVSDRVVESRKFDPVVVEPKDVGLGDVSGYVDNKGNTKVHRVSEERVVLGMEASQDRLMNALSICSRVGLSRWLDQV